MSKQSKAVAALPPEVQRALGRLGENLALARKRRREPQRAWAQRIGVSLPTLIRLEKGDPGVAMGTYATAVWLMGRASALPDLADPALDRGALEMSLREARKRSVRAPVSIEKRLAALAGRDASPDTAPGTAAPSPSAAKRSAAAKPSPSAAKQTTAATPGAARSSRATAKSTTAQTGARATAQRRSR